LVQKSSPEPLIRLKIASFPPLVPGINKQKPLLSDVMSHRPLTCMLEPVPEIARFEVLDDDWFVFAAWRIVPGGHDTSEKFVGRFRSKKGVMQELPIVVDTCGEGLLPRMQSIERHRA
jgi:hypothetical protein